MRKQHKRTMQYTTGIPNIAIRTPFSQEILNEIFRTSPHYPGKPISRESSWLEFKLSFNWGNRENYARTLAAFANTKGGYIVFGIGEKPRLLSGLQNDNFENFDSAKLSEYLNDNFSPEVGWDMHLHEVQGKLFGLIHSEESIEKPIIARKNAGNAIREGEIYYRYRGRTEKIKFPELRQIVDEQRRKEREYWIRHINQVAKIGVKNTAILDTVSGKVTGSGGSFIIDESLLPLLRFIREGEFQEIKGTPTLKLIGELKAIDSGFIQPTKTIYRTRAIRTIDIVHAFLTQKKVLEPLEYIKQICFETSAFLPIYYFINLAKLDIESTLDIIKNIQSRAPSRQKLIERIESNRKEALPIPTTNSETSNKIRNYRKDIINKLIDQSIEPPEIKYLLKSIRTLKKYEIEQSYIFPLLKKLFDSYYFDKNANLADDLRRTICHLDEELNRN